MSRADEGDGRRKGGRPSGNAGEAARRRARVLIPLGILAAMAFVIAFMLLVSQCGTSDDSEIYDDEVNSTAVSLLVEQAAGLRAPA